MIPETRPALTGIVALFALIAAAPAPAQEADRPAPSILILGSGHLNQEDREYDAARIREVVDGISRFAPDMVVVEALPPDWPRGEGRDYRPGFDLETYARMWDAEPMTDEGMVMGTNRAPSDDAERCRQAKRYFLQRDLVNAAYRWLAADCEAEGDSAIAQWLDRQERHEKAVLAFPVARRNGVREIVSFDYQGDDSRWFIGQDLFETIMAEGTPREREEAREVQRGIERFRARSDSGEAGSFIDKMRFLNSDEWLRLQERVYEEITPRLSYERAGRHQTIHYWLRNERMFDNIDDAVEERSPERSPERILVVVGAGHRYFLDELAKKRGYRWVDPHEYLPEG